VYQMSEDATRHLEGEFGNVDEVVKILQYYYY
jgi:hypothetical protein